jgi:hypothetical protein
VKIRAIAETITIAMQAVNVYQMIVTIITIAEKANAAVVAKNVYAVKEWPAGTTSIADRAGAAI